MQTKGDLYKDLLEEAFLMDMEVLLSPTDISIYKAFDKSGAVAHFDALVPGQSSMGSKKIPPFLALVIAYPSNKHVSYSMVNITLDLFNVGAVTDF